MIGKQFLPHRFAMDDKEEIVRYYEQTSTEQIALSFVNALDQAYAQILKYPNMGSPRPEHDLDLSGIRSWSLKRFPHQIYYEVHDDRIELCRVLHPRRDITPSMLSGRRLQ